MPKFLKLTKTILYLSAGILIFIFFRSILPYVAYVVGGAMLLYALEELIFQIVKREYAKLADPLIQIALAVLLFFSNDDIVKVCVIWGVWTLLREGHEITVVLMEIKTKRLAFLDILESIVEIVFSILMILTPGGHHATVHLILLGVELVFSVSLPWLEEWIRLGIESKKKKKA